MFCAPDSSLSSQNHDRKTTGTNSHWIPVWTGIHRMGQRTWRLPICAQLIQSQGLGFMAADRMRRGHDLFTLRDLRTPREGYILEELTDFTGCLPSSSWKGHSKKPLQTSQHGGKVRSSAWKNQIKSALAAELLFSSAPKLFLLLVKPTACQLITTCSQFPLHLPRTSLASQAEMWTEHRTVPYQWAGFRHRDTTAPPQSG